MFRKAPNSSAVQLLEPQVAETHNSHELEEINSYAQSSNEYRSSTLEHLQDPVDRSLGKPLRKRNFDPIDTAAVLLSVVCLAVSLVVISPHYDLSFRLGYTNQLVVIGFLLGIMNLCAKRVVQLPLLLIEANFGRSYLQNYDAILRDSPLVSNVSIPWRVALFCFAALPFGLSACYKLFSGGSVTKSVNITGLRYGLYPPAGLGTAGGELVLMANTTVDFLTASGNDSNPLNLDEFPQAFGLNTLLLSDTSAAYLDLPAPRDVLSRQDKLQFGTFYDITAVVRGTVATYNEITASQRDDANYWSSYYNYAGINYQDLFNGQMFGFFTINTAPADAAGAWDDSWSWIGCFDSSATSSGNATALAFQATALKFIADRHLCNATWRITRDSLRLVRGTCDSTPLNASYQYMQNSELALQQGYASILSSYIGTFCSTRNSSTWKIPTHVVAVAAMYYSRTTYILGQNGDLPTQYKDYYTSGWSPYNSTEEVTLTKPVMMQAWALYLILACQPGLTIFAFFLTIFFHRTPLSRGFGMISILAGINTTTLRTLQGASLSGELSEPVKLNIADIAGDGTDQARPRIGYAIGRKNSSSDLRY